MTQTNRPFLINCDMGESYGNYHIGNDAAIMPFINAANIACGMHGGDPYHIESTINLALQHKVRIGAHPGFPDLQGFGRRVIPMKNEELSSYIKYQVAALKGMVEACGGKLDYVKPHGALYNHIVQNREKANIVIEAVKCIDHELAIMGLAGSHMKELVMQSEMSFIAEAFADRSYESNGQLRARHLEGALISNAQQATAQVFQIISQQAVSTYHGETIQLEAESFCIHGDNPAAPQIAQSIHQKLLA